MKYQQLENLECGWKWKYLIKKWKDGEAITRHIDTSEADAAVAELRRIEHEPTLVLAWIEKHMSEELENKLKQAIRAKRKRHFNAEQVHTKRNRSILITVFGKNYLIEPMNWGVRCLMPLNIYFQKPQEVKKQARKLRPSKKT